MRTVSLLMAAAAASFLYADEVLFLDDFSSGYLEDNWIFYGDPLPEVIDTLGLPPPSFHNNGDTMWGSGVISRRQFDISDGLVMECDMFLSCDERGTWVSATMGLVTPDFRNEQDGGESRIAELNYSYNGELAWMRPHLQGLLRFVACVDGRTGRSCVQMYHQNQLLDGWHRYTIEICTDRSVNYYIDDSLYCRFPQPIPDTVRTVRLQLGNQSSDWGTALHDNLTVRVQR